LVIEAPDLLETPLETNDIVSLKNEQEFKWLGRADFVINSGGVKIHPEEVEKRIAPYLAENFFVWKESDEILQERVVLVVEGNQKTLKINSSDWYQDLHSYEKPKTVYVLSSFYYTETGKVKRNETFELAQDERDSKPSIT
jgi:O-succinylbenzoic acid--CoA ligase